MTCFGCVVSVRNGDITAKKSGISWNRAKNVRKLPGIVEIIWLKLGEIMVETTEINPVAWVWNEHYPEWGKDTHGNVRVCQMWDDEKPADHPDITDVQPLYPESAILALQVELEKALRLLERAQQNTPEHFSNWHRDTASFAQSLSKRSIGFFTGLTEEQQKKALEYRGPENHGDPAYKRWEDDIRAEAGEHQEVLDAIAAFDSGEEE